MPGLHISRFCRSKNFECNTQTNIALPGNVFDGFFKLPAELRSQIYWDVADNALSDPSRQAARGHLKANMLVSHQFANEFKHIVDLDKTLTSQCQALQRYQHLDNREKSAAEEFGHAADGSFVPRMRATQANFLHRAHNRAILFENARIDFDAGKSAPEAIEANPGMAEGDKEDLLYRGAQRDFNRGKSAPEAIEANPGMTEGKKVWLLNRGAERDFDAGKSAPEAIEANPGMWEDEKVSLLNRGAQRDFDAGKSAPEAIEANPGMAEGKKVWLLNRGAQRDFNRGKSARKAIKANPGMTEDDKQILLARGAKRDIHIFGFRIMKKRSKRR
jgi:hypothetical protein